MAVQQLSRAAGHPRQCQMPSLDRIGLVSGALGRSLPAQRRPEPEEPLRKYQNWLSGGSADVGGHWRARRLRGGGRSAFGGSGGLGYRAPVRGGMVEWLHGYAPE